MKTLKSYITAVIILFFAVLNSAYAFDSNCNYEAAETFDSDLVVVMNDTARIQLFNLFKDCILQVGDGALDAVKGIGGCAIHPIDCLESTVDKVKNAYHFITNIVTELTKMWKAIAGLTGQQIRDLVCTTVGEIGTDVIIGIVTLGAASGKLGATIASITLKIQRIASLIQEGIGLPIKLLGKLSEATIDRMKLLFDAGKKKEFLDEMKGLGCAVSF